MEAVVGKSLTEFHALVESTTSTVHGQYRWTVASHRVFDRSTRSSNDFAAGRDSFTRAPKIALIARIGER